MVVGSDGVFDNMSVENLKNCPFFYFYPAPLLQEMPDYPHWEEMVGYYEN